MEGGDGLPEIGKARKLHREGGRPHLAGDILTFTTMHCGTLDGNLGYSVVSK